MGCSSAEEDHEDGEEDDMDSMNIDGILMEGDHELTIPTCHFTLTNTSIALESTANSGLFHLCRAALYQAVYHLS
ncbi:MAG: hypothetical protein N2C13_02525 [Chloroflexota bacterium]